LLSSLAGLLTPTSGSIRLRGSEVVGLVGSALNHYRRETVGVVFQAFNLIASLNARSNVMVPLLLSGVAPRSAAGRADELLALVGLTERAHHRPGQLSGGQQQRVAIARALVQEPFLVLADEPTAHLDYIQVEGILNLLRELASPGRVVIVSTHDDRITHIADRIVELSPQFATADRPPEAVVLTPGEILFTQGDRGTLVYVVDEGAIEIYRVRTDGTEEHLDTIKAGNYFGEIGPLLNLPRSASARAQLPSRLTAYSVRAFRQKFPQTIRVARGHELFTAAP
ncbi:MAG TPA: ATP-binding cassette domain-containing protein, partial [Acidimicrobiales bacterium]|nr:ATP-binding cassette domain-containing protein [Acidimicrobiales bacterium]